MRFILFLVSLSVMLMFIQAFANVGSLSIEDPQIDNKAVDGINGTVDSLSYTVELIEAHIHVSGRWFGAAAIPAGETHIADKVGPSIAAFVLTSGNNAWGAWVQVMGSTDTPRTDYPSACGTKTFFEPHSIQITTANSTVTYFLQFTRGDSGAAGFSANRFTEIVYTPNTNQIDAGPVEIWAGRAPAGSKLWARCLCVGQDVKTIAFYLGTHEYEGL